MLSIHCKIALFFLFPSLVCSQRRACALRGVSGCVHLEPRKTNVRHTGERVWYDKPGRGGGAFFTVLPKVTQMGSTIGHRIDCHGSGLVYRQDFLSFTSIPLSEWGRRQTYLRTGETQDLHANLWNMAILETRIFTKGFLTPVIWNKTWPFTFPRRYVS